ncbi:hypothetical protein [Mycolicibacterium cosmeticum]|uniref:hypothetical protein n=1 Tax=Mycolicibacterium cosmeticum TaxID=258533 RepID=UPI003204C2B6
MALTLGALTLGAARHEQPQRGEGEEPDVDHGAQSGHFCLTPSNRCGIDQAVAAFTTFNAGDALILS